jgi:hypothetical protein
MHVLNGNMFYSLLVRALSNIDSLPSIYTSPHLSYHKSITWGVVFSKPGDKWFSDHLSHPTSPESRRHCVLQGACSRFQRLVTITINHQEEFLPPHPDPTHFIQSSLRKEFFGQLRPESYVSFANNHAPDSSRRNGGCSLNCSSFKRLFGVSGRDQQWALSEFIRRCLIRIP